jgi:hypothetical protein
VVVVVVGWITTVGWVLCLSMMIFVGVNAVMYPNVCLLCVVVVVFGTKYTEWIEMVMKDNPNTSAKNNNIMGKSWRLLNKRHRNSVRIMFNPFIHMYSAND